MQFFQSCMIIQVYYLIVQILKIFSMLTQKSLNCLFSQIKIHFCIKKKVQFGQAVYVSGNIQELGNWNIFQSFRLSWNQDDYWTGTIIIPAYIYDDLSFKYFTCSWGNRSIHQVEWEQGANRKLSIQNDKRCIVCNHKWNKEKIILSLCVEKTVEQQDYYIVGNISQLGRWKINNKMRKNQFKTPSASNFTQTSLKSHTKSSTNINLQNKNIYTFSFYIYRGRQSFQYLFIKKGEKIQAERYPGRIFIIGKENTSPNRLSIEYKKGQINIIDKSQFNQIKYSQINQKIIVGSYLKNENDIKLLKKLGVTDILSIQTRQDHQSHGLSPFYLKKLSQQNHITYNCYEIQDKNPRDFVEKSLGGFKLMQKLMKKQGRVYVHCSAGMYRSPQIIALYLILVQKYSIQSAIQTIKQKHPFARPNYLLICSAVNEITSKGHKNKIQL